MGNRDALRRKNAEMQKNRMSAPQENLETQVDQVLKVVEKDQEKTAVSNTPKIEPEKEIIKEEIIIETIKKDDENQEIPLNMGIPEHTKDVEKKPKKTTKIKLADDEIKKTSLNISRTSLAYLAINAKLEKINQNQLLSRIIKEEQDKKKTYKINYNLVHTKKVKENTTIKAVQLPASQIEFIKNVSAKQMKSVSEYVDELIQKKLESD